MGTALSLQIPGRPRPWALIARTLSTHPVAAMIAVALALRLAVVILVFRVVAAPTSNHEQFGWEMGWVARSIALHQGFSSPFLPRTGPTALTPPLYPYLLAGIFRLCGLYTPLAAFCILAFNSLMASLTCLPIFLTGRRVFGRPTALCAGWLWAAYPFSIYFSADRVWDYALTGFLFAWCLWLAVRLQHKASLLLWVAFGALSALTCQCNPSVMTLLPLFLLVAIACHRRRKRAAITGGLAALLAFCLVLTPWTVRNFHVFHTLIPIRDGFWLEFEAGNHGDTQNCNPPSSHPASDPAAMRRYQDEGEAAFMRSERLKSEAFVRAHPRWFFAVSARRVLRFWTSFWSLDPTYRREEPFDLPATVYCTAMLALTCAGLWQRRSTWTPELTVYLTILLVFPVPYYFTHSSPDYRQPIEPELITLVALGLVGLNAKCKLVQGRSSAAEAAVLCGQQSLLRHRSET